MAREESDREDPLHEATALVERIELRTTGSGPALLDQAARVVAGFRSNGSMSVFFGDDPVYQFNAAGELRRAYCGGLLFKAVRGRLVSLERVRRQLEVQLLSRELTDEEQHSFLTKMQERMKGLATDLANGGYGVAGQVPAEADVLVRVRTWLAEHDAMPIAMNPRV